MASIERRRRQKKINWRSTDGREGARRRESDRHVLPHITTLHLCWTLVWVMDEFLTFFALTTTREATHTSTRIRTALYWAQTVRRIIFFFFRFQSNPISISPHRNRFSPCKKRKKSWRNREQNFRQGNCLEKFRFSPINGTIEG